MRAGEGEVERENERESERERAREGVERETKSGMPHRMKLVR